MRLHCLINLVNLDIMVQVNGLIGALNQYVFENCDQWGIAKLMFKWT